MFKVPLWVLGFCIFVSAQGGDALALRFAPQSVVQPAGSVALLANLLFGWWLNNEPIGRLTPVALVVIITGVALIVIFGPKGTAEWSVDEISQRWTEKEITAYIVCMGGATASLLSLLISYDRRLTLYARHPAPRAFYDATPRPACHSFTPLFPPTQTCAPQGQEPGGRGTRCRARCCACCRARH